MIRSATTFRYLLISFVCLVLIACGGPDDVESDANDYGSDISSDFDESQLPGDFPQELIPTTYNSASYTKLGQVESAAFENDEPATETIDHYIGLLGEPAVIIKGDDSEASAQWTKTPWAVSVTGNSGESIIGITRVNQ